MRVSQLTPHINIILLKTVMETFFRSLKKNKTGDISHTPNSKKIMLDKVYTSRNEMEIIIKVVETWKKISIKWLNIILLKV